MRRLVFLAIALAASSLLAPVVAHAAVSCGDVKADYTESFEEGLGGWEPRSDGKVMDNDWKVYRSTDTACEGKVSLRYDINGRGDDGTVWVQREFAVKPGATKADLRFWVYSKQMSVVGWPIVAYIGPKAPTLEADFKPVGQQDRWLGWKEHNYRVEVPFGVDKVTVALGLSVTWETVRSDYLDYAQVSFS